MSLDVYLTLPGQPRQGGSGIFVRENGQVKEISRAEWDERAPGREPVVVPQGDYEDDGQVYRDNITHNLGKMAVEAGIYQHLWRPDELGITYAGDLVEPLAAGLERLQDNRQHFEQFNPANGWGNYDALVSFVEGYLAACQLYPEATVSVSR